MPAIASDNFNRANETPLAAPWVTGQDDVCNLSSNVVTSPVDVNNRAAIYSGPTWPDNQYSKAKMFTTGTAGGRGGPALYVRNAITVQTYYRFSTDHAAVTNCNISRFLDGFGRVTVQDFTQAWTDGDTWEFRVEGPANAARLRTFLNGVQISDVTYNSTIASGAPGLGVSGSGFSWSMDDWEGGDVVEVGYYRAVGPEAFATSATDLFTVPEGCRYSIRNLHVNNPSGGEIEFTLSVGNDAAGTRLLDQKAVAAGDSYVSRRAANHTIEAGEKIQGFADSTAAVVVIDGYLEAA